MGKGQFIKITNRKIGLTFSILSIILFYHIYNSSWAWRKSLDNVSIGFFPLIVTLLLFLLSLVLAFDRQSLMVAKKLETLTITLPLVGFINGIILLVYFYVLRLIGFSLSTVVFLSLAIYYLGLRSPFKSLLASLVIMLITYFIFYFLGFRLTFLKGVL